MPQENLYEKVVAVTTIYLGPAADRFVSRQIKNHLGKEPDQLGRRDLRTLMDWIETAMFIISDDPTLVANYIEALQGLAGTNKKNRRYAKSDSH